MIEADSMVHPATILVGELLDGALRRRETVAVPLDNGSTWPAWIMDIECRRQSRSSVAEPGMIAIKFHGHAPPGRRVTPGLMQNFGE